MPIEESELRRLENKIVNARRAEKMAKIDVDNAVKKHQRIAKQLAKLEQELQENARSK